MLKLVLKFVLLLAITPIDGQQSLPVLKITDEEIKNFVDDLWQNDENALTGHDLRLDFQGATNIQNVQDVAPKPLFGYVNSSVFQKPTYKAYINLMGNYFPEVGKPEKVTKEESQEVREFYKAVMETKTGNKLYNLLKSKGYKHAVDKTTFRSWLLQLWFQLYSRAKGVHDSSGFEHIFMGELKNNEVTGLHNWIRLYYLESKASVENFDYMGFLTKRFDLMASVKFKWRHYMKTGGSFFIGTSPEFDFSVFTLCFLANRGNKGCSIEVNGCPASIIAHEMYQNGKIHIGSLYPKIEMSNEKCKKYNG
uniref:Endoribonuclease n=1 Tax=Parastrongyloides trichosuri TaxID=131310 RepID=A0A0N5A710_PARTI